MRHLWVVEVWGRGKWRPTTGVHRTRNGGRENLRYCRDTYRKPDDKFRLRKYVPAEGNMKRITGEVK